MTSVRLPDLGESWSLLWEEQGPQGRCLTTDAVSRALGSRWAAFARDLPASARVLDLASGAGIVGRTLLGERGDLHVTGVDCARLPAPAHPQLKLLSSTRMEALPFADSSFDAAVSQFGVEYGEVGKVAPEVARVLRPRAPFCFLVHHRDSAVVRDGTMRRDALRALRSPPLKSAFVSGKADALEAIRKRLAGQFPHEPTVEFVHAYLHRRIGCTRSDRHRLWETMTAMLAPELAMLTALERSAKSAAELGAWLPPFFAQMSCVAVSVVRTASAEPVAWSVHGER